MEGFELCARQPVSCEPGLWTPEADAEAARPHRMSRTSPTKGCRHQQPHSPPKLDRHLRRLPGGTGARRWPRIQVVLVYYSRWRNAALALRDQTMKIQSVTARAYRLPPSSP